MDDIIFYYIQTTTALTGKIKNSAIYFQTMDEAIENLKHYKNKEDFDTITINSISFNQQDFMFVLLNMLKDLQPMQFEKFNDTKCQHHIEHMVKGLGSATPLVMNE